MPILSLMIFLVDVKQFHTQLPIGKTMEAINATSRQIIAIIAMAMINTFFVPRYKNYTSINHNTT
jgi:hypothetical protein